MMEMVFWMSNGCEVGGVGLEGEGVEEWIIGAILGLEGSWGLVDFSFWNLMLFSLGWDRGGSFCCIPGCHCYLFSGNDVRDWWM